MTRSSRCRSSPASPTSTAPAGTRRLVRGVRRDDRRVGHGRAEHRDGHHAVGRRAAVPEAARDAQVRGPGRDRQHEPGPARGVVHLGRPEHAVAARRAAGRSSSSPTGRTISEREKHERLELLYQSSRILQHSPELDSALVALLDHAREMFRAERAEVILYPASRDVRGAPHGIAQRRRRRRSWSRSTDVRDDPVQQRVAARAPAVLLRARGRHGRRRPTMRQAMVSPLRGESGLIGSLIDRQPPDRGHELHRRRPAPARDARQPGGGRARERPARAVAGRAVAAQGAAPPPGLSRPADRPRQPDACSAEQVDERLLAPRDGLAARSSCSSTSTTSRSSTTRSATRPATGSSSRSPTRLRACVRGRRHGGPPRRRRVRDPARGRHRRSGTRSTWPTASSTRSRISFPIQGQEITIGASIGIAAGTRRHRPGRRPAPQRRRRDVHAPRRPGKTAWRSSSRRCTRRSSPATGSARSWHAASARGELEVVLPADRRARHRPDDRGRGARPLAPPDPRPPRPDRLHPDRRGERARSSPLGRWVLTEACRDMAAWQRAPARRRAAHRRRQPRRPPSSSEVGFVDDLEEILAVDRPRPAATSSSR